MATERSEAIEGASASSGHRSPSGSRRSVLAELYPERAFAGFCRADGRFLFYSIVADLLTPQSVVLDLGAGRGVQTEASSGHLHRMMDFRGRCRRVIGIDPDPAVLQNRFLDEAHVIDAGGRFPLEDSSIDVIVAYAVLEHVADPAAFVHEVERVLSPDGWFCAWTPNKWGYVGIGTRLIPNRLHAKLVAAAEPRDRRQEADVFPTLYRMNTLSAIRRWFDPQRFEHFSFLANGSPSYHFGSVLIARFWQLIMLLSLPGMGKTLFAFVRKRSTDTAR